jgi:hypothetical protein
MANGGKPIKSDEAKSGFVYRWPKPKNDGQQTTLI